MTTGTFEHADRYFWHDAIARDLRRLRDECGTTGYNVKGLAANVRMGETDVRTYVGQMLAWGELVEIEPLWDYPETWVALA